MSDYLEKAKPLVKKICGAGNGKNSASGARCMSNAALAVGAAAVFATTLPVHAQQPVEAEGRQLEEITVTGTRIRTPGLVSNSPVTTLQAEEMQYRQPVAAEELIKQLPVAVPAIGPGTNNGANGLATIDLRGLGPSRTLVLIDGRRLVPGNLNGHVDTNAIPVALLDRVDLLTGGASVLYGADAVSGVVNFILKRDFEGIDLGASYSTSGDGDADRFRADLTLGANTPDGRGNVAMSFGFTDRDPLLQGDRSFGLESINSSTGAAEGSSAAVPTVTLLGGDLAPFDPDLGAFRQPFESSDAFNFNPLNFYEAPLERTQITALGHYEVAESVEIYGQALFTDSFVAQQLAASGTFFNNWQFPVGNPFVPEAARQQICAEHGVAPADCVPAVMDAEGNVTGGTEEVTIQLRRRMTELGPRLGDFENQMFQWTVGLRGDLPFAEGWDWDIYWQDGEAKQSRLLGNWGSFSKVQQALRAVQDEVTGEPVCLDPSNGCVPLNLFGPEGSITEEMIGFINLSSIQTQNVSQEVGGASIAGDLGERFQIPWAGMPIGVAAGVEHRRVTASTLSDGSSQIDSEVLGTGAATPDRSGRFTLNEIYLETIVPIVSDRPGARSLFLEGGVRHTEFETTDKIDYRSWKGGVSWEPIDSLRFRGTVQRATRSPNVNELFQPVVTGLSNLSVDPCQGNLINQAEANTPGTLSNLCRQTGVPENVIGVLPAPAAGQINVAIGGNPLLGPEEADTLTVGFVWQPEFVDDLTVTLDYYEIDLEKAVERPSSGDIIQDCYSPSRNPNFEFNEACQAVGRSPTGGDLNASDASGVALPLENLGKIKTSGFDLGLHYGLDLDVGRLSFDLNLTNVQDWKTQPTPESIDRDCLGFYSVSCDGNVYDYKWTQRTTFSTDRYDVSLLWRYLSSLDVEPAVADDFLPEFSSISTYNYFDLAGAWRATDSIRVNVTVNNLFDKNPPAVGNTIGTTTANSGNTFPQWYDVVGRYFTVGVTVDL